MNTKGIKIKVVLVEPLYDGNVGSVARSMKNFGYDDLALVNPCRLKEQSRAMAMHALDVLENASIHSTILDAVGDSNLIIAATGNPGKRIEKHIRMPSYTPVEIKHMLEDETGLISILFGREDKGLFNSELELCDMIMNIPTGHEYPSMNISHACTVVLYELSNIKPGSIELAERFDLDLMYDHFHELMEEIEYPEYKLDKTMLMVRRILGRSRLTAREVQTMRGLMRRIQYRIRHS
ncbi:MAG: RNA methyltransferase [Methanosarcinales archaeon]|nr:RNA methyltransferase [Methanosarcinales archaeon]